MNTKTSIGAIFLSIVALIGSAVAVISHQSPIAVQAPIQTVENHNVRGVSSDFSNVPYINVGGVTEWYSSAQFKTGTSTLCSVPVPTGSSTLQYASWRVTGNASTSAQNITIGTSTSITGTSTNTLVTASAAANATSTGFGFIASSYVTGGVSTGQFVNFVTDAAGGATTANGFCQAEFTQN